MEIYNAWCWLCIGLKGHKLTAIKNHKNQKVHFFLFKSRMWEFSSMVKYVWLLVLKRHVILYDRTISSDLSALLSRLDQGSVYVHKLYGIIGPNPDIIQNIRQFWVIIVNAYSFQSYFEKEAMNWFHIYFFGDWKRFNVFLADSSICIVVDSWLVFTVH